MFRRSLVWLLVLTLSTAAAQLRAASEDEIEAARKKGVQYLLDTQLEDGSWEYAGHEIGITSLCALALIENGVAVDDPVIEKAQRYVVDNYLDKKGTYDIALSILLLSRVGDRDNRNAIRDLAARLKAGQNTHGGWGYTCPDVRAAYLSGAGEQPDRPAGPGDNSCTQFATLGLWVASRSGIDIDDTMAQVAYRFVMDQNEDGGWPYKTDPAMPQGSRNSMTFAGLFCLTVARANRIRAVQKAEANGKDPPKLPEPLVRPEPEPSATNPDAAANPDNPDAAAPAQPKPTKKAEEDEPFVDPGAEAKTLQEDPIFKAGFDLATKYAGGVGPGASRYFMWSVERMGVILGLEKFGTTDWFNKGADALLATQGKPAGENEGIEGAWQIAGTGSSLSETSFAILFLRKANLGSDITRLLEGDPGEPYQIVTQSSKPRFLTLDRAIEAAQAGDEIQISSNRPIDTPHLLIDKTLTLSAAPGYTPVLRYEVGFDARGRRSDPQTDASARYILGVKSGVLTLEGLRLLMEPPRSSSSVRWIGVSVEGGTLRMLNCSVAETARQGYAPISLSAAGNVEVRNSLLIGGRCAVEVTAAGEQTVDIDNSILFSTSGVKVLPGKQTDGNLKLNLERTVVQAPEVFNFAKVASPIEINSQGVAYQADSLGLSFLAARAGKEKRTWTGEHNLYDLKKWIGFEGTANATIKDSKTWSTFWGESDANGLNRIVTFAGKRPQGAFTVEVNPEDYEFAATSQVYGSRRRTGVNPVYVGPGYNFALFKEGFDYNVWREQAEQLAAAP